MQGAFLTFTAGDLGAVVAAVASLWRISVKLAGYMARADARLEALERVVFYQTQPSKKGGR